MQGPFKCRQGHQVISSISDHLLTLKSFVPYEFARKPRPLKEVNRWKATEFRQFLLYTEPVVLTDEIPKTIYQNFLLLSCGILILLDKNMCKIKNKLAKDLLRNFVQHFYELYESNMVVYNVHNLIHLVDDSLRHGSLETVSANATQGSITMRN